MDRLEQVLQETIELEELAELDVEYYGLEELRKRFEIFDNVKNEAFQIENDNELSSEQKARIDKITDIAYENANKFSNSGYTDMMIFFRSELQKENKDPKKFTFNFEYTNNHQDKTKVVKIQLV